MLNIILVKIPSELSSNELKQMISGASDGASDEASEGASDTKLSLDSWYSRHH